jgi:Xaa-Pro dipeptidase
MRDVLADGGQSCPHHMGHGIGFSWHDTPRVVPDAAGEIAAGMVLALEPAVYTDDGHLRVEQVVHVTGDGPRVLSGHDLALEGAGA